MFNFFKDSSAFTTYYDIESGQVKVVPNVEYNRHFFEVKNELYPFANRILRPHIANKRLEFETIIPETGIKVYRQLNLEVLLANLCLWRSFITTHVPELLSKAYKPMPISQEDQLREAGLKLRGQLVELTQSYNELASERDALSSRVAELEGLLGDKWADIKVMMAKFSEVNIQVRFLEVYSESDSHTFVFKNVGLTVDDAKLKRVAESMPGLLAWVTEPPSYEVARGEIILEFDTRDIEAQLDSIQEDWLPGLAQCEQNLMIFGAKGSGKSELVINYIAIVLNEIHNAHIEYLQPKPEDKTPWGLVPTALGFDACFERHNWLIQEYERRNDTNIKAKEAGQPLPTFDPIFAMYEEFQTMVSVHPDPKKFCKEVERLVSFARTLGINVLVVIQVASIRNFPGWTRASMTQYNRLYIGESINTAMDYLGLEEKKQVRKLYAMYRASKRQYYGLLLKPTGGTPIYDLPEPGSYTIGQERSEAVVKCKRRDFNVSTSLNPHIKDLVSSGVLTCPSCGSTRWVPHNYRVKSGGMVHLRCHNHDCKTKISLTL